MTAVKDHPLPRLADEADVHVAMLVGKFYLAIKAAFDDEDWDGLRQSHFRLLSYVPREGIPITDLAVALGMSKQACGQFVTGLAGSGHLAVGPDAGDRRVRLVTLTPLGRRTVKAVTQRVRRLETQWAKRVGVSRYATFRQVLEELVVGTPHP
jgi:DNA-binding MarR family transcriptional regulator